jgi:ABC-type Mn2+/Zn2+ transport system ATPase subunit
MSQTEDAAVLVVRGLRLSYDGLPVLDEVHLTVRRGEFWFILGPNGTGKSTLLRAVLGVISPAGGHLELAPELASGRRIGFVPQRCDLKPTLPMSVSEFVLLGLAGTYARRSESRENLKWALEEVSLQDKEGESYWSLSGGQRQRALVARGLVRRPDLLILDEPTNGLDLPSEESFMALVEKLNRELGITVLLVTHAIALAARFATHVALFHGGRVLAGSKEEVLTSRNLSEAYKVSVPLSCQDPAHLNLRDARIS